MHELYKCAFLAELEELFIVQLGLHQVVVRISLLVRILVSSHYLINQFLDLGAGPFGVLGRADFAQC